MIAILPMVLFFLASVSFVAAQEVRVGIGFAIPPYVIKESNSGVEVDVIREAFRRQGHEAVFVYLPNLRLPLAFSQGEVDCIATNAAYDLAADSGRKVYPSATTVVFQNYAVTLQRQALSVQSVASMVNMRVLAFNNASKYLGPEFRAMSVANSRYSELADQSLQVRMLYSGRVDVVVSDKRIFLWWRQKLLESATSLPVDLKQPVFFNAVFPSAPRHVAFSDPALSEAFDKALSSIKIDGTYDAIVGKYIGAGQ